MLTNLKKKSIKTAVTICILLSIIGGCIIFFLANGLNPGGGWIKKVMDGPKDINEVANSDLYGQYIETDVNTLIDCFATYYKKSDSGIETTTHAYYYMVTTDGKYLALKVQAKDMALANAICDANYTAENIFTTKESIHIKGYVDNLDTDELNYFYKWFTDPAYLNMSKAEADQYIIPVVLVNSPSVKPVTLLFAGAGGLCILIGILVLVLACSGFYQRKINKKINNSGDVTLLNRMEQEFSHAKNFRTLYIGREFVFIMKSFSPKILSLKNDVIWCYKYEYRNKGISTYYVKFFTKDKKYYLAALKNENTVHEALDNISRIAPWVAIGYSKDLEKDFVKNTAYMIGEVDRRKAECLNQMNEAAFTTNMNM